jgi:hypothetical protein
MGINKPYKVSKNQLNVKGFKADAKTLMEAIKGLLGDLNYDADDPKYKYQGKGAEIKQVQFRVSGDKNVDHYTKYIIEVEVTVDDGKVTKTDRKTIVEGTGKIILKSELLLDYDDKWVKDPFLHFLKGIYEKYWYFNTRKDHEVKVAQEMFSIRDDIKKLVNMR